MYRAEPDGRSRVVTGPRGRLVFGSTRDLREDPLGLLQRSRNEFGDVVRFRYFGPFTWYFFAHPNDVEHILVTRQQDFPKGAFGRVLNLVLPNGLASSDDDAWARQRRLLQPGFHASALSHLAGMIVSIAEEHLDQWLGAATGGRFIEMARAMWRLSLDIAGRALLGSDLRETMDVIELYGNLALEQLDYRLLHPLSPIPFLPTPTNLRYRSSVREANRVIAAVVARRRTQPDGPRDLLSMLLSARDEDDEGLSDIEVRDQIKTMLIAGYETTGTTLAWFFYSLTLHADVERRVRDEILAVVGDRRPGAEDLQALTYTRQVLNETLRLYPPAPWLGRQARQACDVNGCRVPRNAVVCVSPFVTQRHPAFWAKPEVFDPDHFAPEVTRQRPKAAFFPFGAGPRYCVGQAFAVMEMLLVIAAVVPRWHFRLRPDATVRPQLRGTLQPEFGLPMTIEPAAAPDSPHVPDVVNL